MALYRDGATPVIVLTAVAGGVAASRAILTVLDPVRASVEQTSKDDFAGRNDDETVGWGYAIFVVIDKLGPPVAAWFMTQWFADMLPRVPEEFDRIALAAAGVAICLAGLRSVVRWIRWQRAQPRR